MTATDTITHAQPTDHKSRKQSASDQLRNTVADAQDSVNQAAQSVRDSATTAVQAGADYAQTFQGEFDSAVRRNPTLAVLGAMGVGLALGLALTKRS